MNIADPDNGADITVTLKISGNRLVRVCNAVQQMMYETKRLIPTHDGFEALNGWRELNDIVERIRDELAVQRTAR